MGYLSVENLYRCWQHWQEHKEVYALEKIHGTSAHITYDPIQDRVSAYSGGADHAVFVKLFDFEKLKEQFKALQINKKLTLFGEAYGGKILRMSQTYGQELRFVAFDFLVGEKGDHGWYDVPQAEIMAKRLGQEFVDYVRIPCTLEALDAERDKPSVQAKRNGMGDDKLREGIVLRPIVEATYGKNRERCIAKHKGAAFCETAHMKTKPIDLDRVVVLAEAEAIAAEWVTEMRLDHVLNGREPSPEMISDLLKEMCADIEKESAGEIKTEDGKLDKLTRGAVCKRTAGMIKQRMENKMKESVAAGQNVG